MKNLPLHVKIIIGLILGIIWAIISSYFCFSSFTLDWFKPFGDIFINILKMIAVPLVLFSVIGGINSLGAGSALGRLGLKTLGFYLVTTVMAISIGLVFVNLIKPGSFAGEDNLVVNRIKYEMWAVENGVELKDDRSYLTNPEYASYVDEARTKFNVENDPNLMDEKVKAAMESASKQKDKGPLSFIVEMVPSNIFKSFTEYQMLQVIFFAILFGLVMIALPEQKVAPMKGFVDSANEIFIKMVDMVMSLAPFFVFALMAGAMADLAGDDLGAMLNTFKALGVYALVVVGGLLVLAFGIYPVAIASRIRKMTGWSFSKSYMYFIKGIRPAQLLAFSTSSSAATLPVTIECVNDNLGVEEEVSSFVLPIGATVNMDGTSLYQAVAVVFLAQLHMVDLDFAQQLTIVLTATLASIGSAAVPSAGLIMLVLVLSSVGLNPAWIAIIFPIDRILDMCRTVVNVTGDATVSTLVAETENRISVVTDQRL
ncbi:MAG: dicarboxylate/amino acid:cation symporter [Flavobacteriia bacterium]|nr:dicarboxylate/amino acid:cation symporter [Flavobacteriia bacterium]